MKHSLQRLNRHLWLALAVTVLVVASLPHSASAAVANPTPGARISFTFDDGFTSVADLAQPTLSQHGLTGTAYITTGCVGMTTAPNTCRADTDATYMTWPQIQALQNNYGWEIGSHTVRHFCLVDSLTATPDGDCQRLPLTPDRVDAQLKNSKDQLLANGINATSFAPPYGDYNNTVLAQIAKYYTSMRGFQDQNTNVWPYNDYLVNNLPMQQGVTTVPVVQAAIDQAIANDTWLVLTFHEISTTPSNNPDDYEYGVSELDQIAAYVAAKQASGQIQSVNVRDGLVGSDVNMLPNGAFTNGIADGWTTDSPASVTADAGNNGSYPAPLNAIKFTSPAGGGNAHLFSPRSAVTPGTTYMYKNFLNVQTLTSGVVAFYVDEYDASGNWVSGKYVKGVTNTGPGTVEFTYSPQSAQVAKASLQTIVMGGSGVHAYFDDVKWYQL